MPLRHYMLSVLVDDPVSPEHLALRIAQACAVYGALRPGEALEAEGVRYLVADEPCAPPAWLLG